MDMQNVAKLNIPEGEVRTIHDKDGNLIWGKVSYGVKYKGETSQQTYTGKNLVYTSGKTDGGITATYNAATGETTISGKARRSYAVFGTVEDVFPAGTYTFSIQSAAPCSVGVATRTSGGTRQGHAISAGATNTTFTISEDSPRYDIYLTNLTVDTTYNFTFKAMLESGSSATSFEPYVGGIPAPNPDYPQAVQTVTGENTLTISDGTNTQSYEVNLGNIELCKIGDYQDYIYKSGDKWYVHKEIGKHLFDGSETFTSDGSYSGIYQYRWTDSSVINTSSQDAICALSDRFYGRSYRKSWEYDFSVVPRYNYNALRFMTSLSTTYGAFQTWLASNNTTVYYVLATPTDTEITNEALVAQLEAIEQWLTRYGYSATVSGNLPIIIDRTAL